MKKNTANPYALVAGYIFKEDEKIHCEIVHTIKNHDIADELDDIEEEDYISQIEYEFDKTEDYWFIAVVIPTTEEVSTYYYTDFETSYSIHELKDVGEYLNFKADLERTY